MIVLDTHIWHWWVNQISERLSSHIVDLIECEDTVGVSAISCFEMAWLTRHGRIDLGMTYDEWFSLIDSQNTTIFLPVTPSIASRAVALPEHHRDPQDRIIIATALEYGARLISFDGMFKRYHELESLLIDLEFS